MTSNELRQKYLKFFEDKGHKIIPAGSLVPEGDSTTLFTGSGMQPMIPYLLGAKHPLGTRIVDSQKSFRAEDIEEVGDNRHTTFFEMLGNWSFGDYWKQEQLSWMFEFLTEIVGIDPKKLYITVFLGDPENNIPRDDESADIWKALFEKKGIEAKIVSIGSESNGYQTGMEDGRIFYYDVAKNWWSRSGTPQQMPAGEPGGPDSEMFYEFTDVEHDPKFGKFCHPNCDCGRFLEIGNNVFMEYVKNTDGTFSKLPQRNVDFGGGLERILSAKEDKSDIFDLDIFANAKSVLETGTGKLYVEFKKEFRIILDHIRASIFLIGDGVSPSNTKQGYVLRRLIRRAVFMADRLGARQGKTSTLSPLSTIADSYIQLYMGQYPTLAERANNIFSELENEEKKFRETLSRGLKKFNLYIETFLNGQPLDRELRSSVVFDLFQSDGFPFELIKEIARDNNLSVDEVAFKENFRKHQELSRTSSAGQFKGGLASHSDKIVRLHTVTHLMNAALRKVLGQNVWQKGSNITEERTRFDFTHDKKMTDEEKQEVEKLVNDWIERDLEVKKEIMPMEEARKLGAIGVFGEKYPDTVSVYTIYDKASDEVVSREFCGGPHVEYTGVIGKFKIQKEEAVSAGVRRIKAIIE